MLFAVEALAARARLNLLRHFFLSPHLHEFINKSSLEHLQQQKAQRKFLHATLFLEWMESHQLKM